MSDPRQSAPCGWRRLIALIEDRADTGVCVHGCICMCRPVRVGVFAGARVCTGVAGLRV